MRKEFRIYRPNKQNNGSASKFQFTIKKKDKYEEPMIFWEMAEQTGVDDNNNASFDWASQENKNSKSVTMKLGMNDIGEILCVLCGRKEFVGYKREQGLFHENQLGNTVLKFTYLKDKDIFYAALSSKKSGVVLQVKHSISIAEAIVLEQLLKDFIVKYYGWSERQKTSEPKF